MSSVGEFDSFQINAKKVMQILKTIPSDNICVIALINKKLLEFLGDYDKIMVDHYVSRVQERCDLLKIELSQAFSSNNETQVYLKKLRNHCIASQQFLEKAGCSVFKNPVKTLEKGCSTPSEWPISATMKHVGTSPRRTNKLKSTCCGPDEPFEKNLSRRQFRNVDGTLMAVPPRSVVWKDTINASVARKNNMSHRSAKDTAACAMLLLNGQKTRYGTITCYFSNDDEGINEKTTADSSSQVDLMPSQPPTTEPSRKRGTESTDCDIKRVRMMTITETDGNEIVDMDTGVISTEESSVDPLAEAVRIGISCSTSITNVDRDLSHGDSIVPKLSPIPIAEEPNPLPVLDTPVEAATENPESVATIDPVTEIAPVSSPVASTSETPAPPVKIEQPEEDDDVVITKFVMKKKRNDEPKGVNKVEPSIPPAVEALPEPVASLSHQSALFPFTPNPSMMFGPPEASISRQIVGPIIPNSTTVEPQRLPQQPQQFVRAPMNLQPAMAPTQIQQNMAQYRSPNLTNQQERAVFNSMMHSRSQLPPASRPSQWSRAPVFIHPHNPYLLQYSQSERPPPVFRVSYTQNPQFPRFLNSHSMVQHVLHGQQQRLQMQQQSSLNRYRNDSNPYFLVHQPHQQ